MACAADAFHAKSMTPPPDAGRPGAEPGRCGEPKRTGGAARVKGHSTGSAATTAAASAPRLAAWGRIQSQLGRWLKRLLALGIGLVLSALLAEAFVMLFLGEQVKFPRHVVEASFGLRYNDP